MPDVILNASKFSIPTTLTAAALCITSAVAPTNELPAEYHLMDDFTVNQRSWEKRYVPKETQKVNFERIEFIHSFAMRLLQDSEDIPGEFSDVLNEDFWEIV